MMTMHQQQKQQQQHHRSRGSLRRRAGGSSGFPQVPKPIFRPSREHRLCDPDGGRKPGAFRMQGLGAWVITVHLPFESVCRVGYGQ